MGYVRAWIGAAGGVLAAAVITYIWWVNSLSHPTPTQELGVLAASAACLSSGGAARPGGPTIAAAWLRTAGKPLDQSQPLYHGDHSIEVSYERAGTPITVGFIRDGARLWRPARDPASAAWARQVCG